MPWSKEQLRAITTYDKNLLVAAAAGSGKTAVLVERIIRRLLDQQCDIDEILVVTFTNAAAAEMRERVARAIQAALETNPGAQYLERQLVLMNAAAISTLHAFCQSIIRQNFHQLDIDPKFRLASEQEMELLRHDVLESLFAIKYDSAESEFLDFVDDYGSERSDEVLYEIVLKLYQYACSQPFPENWLASLPQQFLLPEGISLEQTLWMGPVKRELTLAFAACKDACHELLELADDLACDFYLPVLQQDRELIENLQQKLKRPWPELQAAVYGAKFATLRAPKDTDEEIKEIFKKKRQKIKDRISAVKENYFLTDEPKLLEDLRAAGSQMQTICSLTAQFSQAFTEAKAEKAVLDFNDLEHFALQILLAEGSTPEQLLPSPAAKALQDKYCEVMVDEYQDTNGVQEAILSLVRKKDKPNLFLVGDVKQSIYRFRLAEPELFLRKYREYPCQAAECERIDLAQNFRSRPEILAAINFIFAQVMSENIAELPYGRAEELHSGPDYPKCEGCSLAGSVELDLIDADDAALSDEDRAAMPADEAQEDLSGFALEARHIAHKLKEMMQSGAQVFDKQRQIYRPLAWRDIVVLLRSVKGKASVLLESMREQDIPAYAAADDGYFQETEIQVMLSLLHIIDNPRQDIALAAVLYSPILGLTAADLAEIRLVADGDLFGALLAASSPQNSLETQLKDKVTAFLQQLGQWRNLARRASVPELIRRLFADTGYYDYVGGMPGGLLRQANLRMLYDRAGEYEQTNFRGLFRFLRFVEKMQNSGTDLAAARTLGESENVVRIMSIHKSKGLEFPVVVVADLGKQFNLRDQQEVLLVHKTYGLGPYVIDQELSLRYPTFARQALACQLGRENKAEELRVLYVALTRAREKLVLVGSVKHLAEKAESWCRQISSSDVLLPDHMIADAKTYLDWIAPAVARHADGGALRALAQSQRPHYKINYPDTSQWQVQVLAAGTLNRDVRPEKVVPVLLAAVAAGEKMPATENEKWVWPRLAWQYPHGAAAVPAKLSVSEAKRRFESLDGSAAHLFDKRALSLRPRFIQETQGLSSGEYGTLVHGVLQHLDLNGDLSPAGIRGQLLHLAAREVLLSDQIELVPVAKVAAFFASPLGLRLRQAKKVRRELAFSRMIPAKRFYPEIADEQEKIFIQGVLDLLFDEDEGMVLVDYKTDKRTEPDLIRGKYKLQLELYREAAMAILKRPIKECYIYLLHDGSIVPL